MIYFFDSYALDTNRRELRCETGPVPLQPQVFDLLVYLIRNRDRVISKDDMLVAVWGGRIVSESTLASRISAARTALGDSGESQRLIRTLPRKGVRFIGTVREQRNPANEAAQAAPVIEAAAPEPLAPLLDRPPSFERRQLTFVSCELLLGAGAARMELEDLSYLIGAYHRWIKDTVRRFNGSIGHLMGVTALAYFGYPVAHEDDAEQAVRAGLALCGGAGHIEPHGDLQLHARVGISTGRVIIGDAGDGDVAEQAPVGEAPDTASQLQNVARPESVLIDTATRRLIGTLFKCREIEPINVPGTVERLRAWNVLGAGSIESRFEALRPAALTPLVGREEEMELLRRRWTQAKFGEGRVVLISGEPGIGKSRLAAALQEQLRLDPHTAQRYFCAPHSQASALRPFIASIERAASFEVRDSAERKFEKLEAWLGVTSSAEDTAILADLLAVPVGARYPRLDLAPQRKRKKLFEALLQQMESVARQQPLLMIFEDLHWGDPTSLEAFGRTVDRIASLRALLIVTFRPEFEPPWIGQPHVTALALNRLGHREVDTMIDRVIGNKPLPADVRKDIIERTDGIPLFVEEMTKAVLETGGDLEAMQTAAAVPPSAHAVPASLHASLMARLDRLGPAKELAQIGAAIGREFSHALLAAVARKPEAELVSLLDRLVRAGLLFGQGAPPHATYLFKHVLVQDAAYGTLLRQPRRALHARIADTLESQFADIAEAQPDLLARHYAEAGLNDKAVQYWIQAGNRSIARSAMGEAEAQFQKALARIPILPETREQALLELEIQSSLGSVQLAIGGFTAQHVAQTYERARELWEQLGCPPEFIRVPWGQVMYHVNRAELTRTRVLAESLMDLAELGHDQAALLPARLCMGGLDLACGTFARSRSHLEEAHRIYNPEFQSRFVQTLGIDPHVHVLSFLSLTLFFLGYPDQALARRKEAIAEARETNHRPSLAIALSSTSRFLACLGDDRLLAESASELVTLATEQGFPYWLRQGEMYQGWIKIRNGEIDAGLSRVRNAAAAFQAIGAELWMPIYRAMEAKAETLKDNTDVAMSVLDDALRSSRARGENWFEAELLRRKGELLRNCHPTMAEALFREAIDVASRQEAKLWELRATVSLAGLYADVGRRNEAYKMLAPVHGWFTEGFDTLDLKEAKARLDELHS